ncbi:hypothetical protein [Rhodococcus triatomae]|nr:hypothetical protein G419_03963 [Rhodococcus triatomae BKS 15-14]
MTGGRLLADVGNAQWDELTGEVAELVLSPDPAHDDYVSVLEWVVTTTADVIASAMGQETGPAEFAIHVMNPDGSAVPAETLPGPAGSVWAAVLDVLDGEPEQMHRHLESVAQSTKREEQAQVLLDSVVWLDRVLTVSAPDDLSALPG